MKGGSSLDAAFIASDRFSLSSCLRVGSLLFLTQQRVVTVDEPTATKKTLFRWISRVKVVASMKSNVVQGRDATTSWLHLWIGEDQRRV